MNSVPAIPPPVINICRALANAGFQCVIVGGAVRDLLRSRQPHDWDLATDARPEQIKNLFRRVLLTGERFGTVTVLDYGLPCEITSFRAEGAYEDGRHPSWVRTGVSLNEDLSRRDFTINAMAYDPLTGSLIDPFGGADDLRAGIIRAVGDPDERFREDALRMLRALRIVSEEGFALDGETEAAIARTAPALRRVSGERQGTEMTRLLMGMHAGAALRLLQATGLLAVLWPEVAPAADLWQDGGLRMTVWEHTVRTVHYAVRRLTVRLAALGHDWGKVRTHTPDGRFPDHHRVSAEMFGPVLAHWCLPKTVQQHVLDLIRHHMFGPIEDKTLRRWIGRYGAQWVYDLIDLREADALGSGAEPVHRSLPEMRERLDRMLREETAFSPSDLALNGHDIMAILGIAPGPEVGRWKEALYQYVLEDPSRNTREALRAFLIERRDRISPNDAATGQRPDDGNPRPRVSRLDR